MQTAEKHLIMIEISLSFICRIVETIGAKVGRDRSFGQGGQIRLRGPTKGIGTKKEVSIGVPMMVRCRSFKAILSISSSTCINGILG